MIESEISRKNRQFIERLGAKVLDQPTYFTNVIFNNDLKMLGRKALLFVPETELVELRKPIERLRAVHREISLGGQQTWFRFLI